MRYPNFLRELFGERFPVSGDYDSLADFRLAALTALVKGIEKYRHGALPTDGDPDLAECRRLLQIAIHNHEKDALRQRIEQLEQEIATLKVSMEDRKVIERAKGILMRAGINEETAYRRLQQMAQRMNMKLVVVARKLLDVGELFEERQ
jgi:hypothetical protein